MKNNFSLNLLYNFLPTSQNGNIQSCYKILKLFSDSGEIPSNIIESVYQNYPSFGPGDWVCFENLDELGRFSLELCQKMECPEVLILSAQDYNLGVENCSDLRSFRDIFRRYGTSVENPDKIRKKNVFSKLFN